MNIIFAFSLFCWKLNLWLIVDCSKKFCMIGTHILCGSIASESSIMLRLSKSPITVSPGMDLFLSCASFLLMWLNFIFSICLKMCIGKGHGGGNNIFRSERRMID